MLQHWTHVVSRLAKGPSNHRQPKKLRSKKRFFGVSIGWNSWCVVFLFRKMQATNSFTDDDTVALQEQHWLTCSMPPFHQALSQFFSPQHRGNEKLQIFGGTHEVLFRKSTYIPTSRHRYEPMIFPLCLLNVGYCWWFRNPANQLRLVVNIPWFTEFWLTSKVPKGGWPWDFWTFSTVGRI